MSTHSDINNLDMSKSFLIFLLVLQTAFVTGACQTNCDMEGTWLIRNGNVTRNYERARVYSENQITFLKDSVELASGFFYNTLDPDADNYALGSYPFVYYGKREMYKIIDDSLYIYSKPYKQWDAFKMNCTRTGIIELKGKYDSLTLQKTQTINLRKDCSMKYIKAHIYEQGLGLYDINYRVTYSKDDVLLFEQGENDKAKFKTKKFKLEVGTFGEICNGFNNVNFLKLKKDYPTKLSEMTIIEFEVGFENGKVVSIQLENDDYPEELRLALIPVLYGHQQFLYYDLQPIKWH